MAFKFPYTIKIKGLPSKYPYGLKAYKKRKDAEKEAKKIRRAISVKVEKR